MYSNPFDLIYTDLWGPSPVLSNTGYSYSVTFVDVHTRFTWLYLLRNKSETLDLFKQFHTLVKTQFNLPIKLFGLSGGGSTGPLLNFLQNMVCNTD